MNNNQLDRQFNQLKNSVEPTIAPNESMEKQLVDEYHDARKRSRSSRRMKRLAIVAFGLISFGAVGVAVADNIQVSTQIESSDQSTSEHSISAWDYFLHHVHAHLREVHRHIHGEPSE